jgi:imidazoleglycerol phosphate synthase glutamine amidotransferase subunit HisH
MQRRRVSPDISTRFYFVNGYNMKQHKKLPIGYKCYSEECTCMLCMSDIM